MPIGRLISNGAEVRFHPMMHARLLVLDESIAIVGSADLKTDISNNFELAIYTSNPTIIRQIRTFYEHVWKEASPAKTKKTPPKT